MAQLHLNLLAEGVIVSRDGLGALSTPIGEAEIDEFIAALDRAVAALPEDA
jgi:glutamate-1-semialdehyde aminotransferase